MKNISGQEHMQRINYLYQAGNLLMNKNFLSVYYCNLAINIAKKTVQRLDTSMKRTICKGCHNLLANGINCRTRIKRKQLRITCLLCNTVKRFNLKNFNKIWSENPEALLEKTIC